MADFGKYERAAYLANSKLTAAQDKKLFSIYEKAGKRLLSDISKAPAARRKHLRTYARRLAGEINDLLTEYTEKAASNSATAHLLAMKDVLEEAGRGEVVEDIRKVVPVVSKKAAKLVATGEIYKTRISQSARIWRHTNQAVYNINQILDGGVTQGMDAKKLAKLLEPYVLPSKRSYLTVDTAKHLGIGRDIEYNSLRMSRTSISNAATASMRQWGKLNPFVEYVRWCSAHATGRTCGICLDLDGKLFPVDNIPLDHPNGLCWTEAVLTNSFEDLVDEVIEWTEDPESSERLENWYQNVKNM